MNRRFLKLKEFVAAQDILQEQANTLLVARSETIAVGAGLRRLLVAPVYAKVSHPNYNASAMDGIALRAASTYGAHERQPLKLTLGVDCWPVDTGDCLPDGCDAVVMIEDVVELANNRLEISSAVYPWQNVRVVGEDIIIGDMILPGNHIIQAADIGALLAAGIAEIVVRQKLKVGIVPTGNEVRAVGQADRLTPGEIIDSNSGMLAALIEETGAVPQIYPIVADDKELLRAAFLQAARENDLTLFFHHQERIIPGWLDKKIVRRVPDAETLSNVLMVFPSQSFVESLPDQKVPDREDFLTYVDDHAQRVKNWYKAVELSAPLGEDFLELVESGKIRNVVEKL